uniref:Uncharacterized protein n=1 Tax=Oryza sativa subsp. japonica TaxID=39947 RepID=Q6I639_ORYSJ|nr:hypothetical protein [Oryza sativa Japonica Group]
MTIHPIREMYGVFEVTHSPFKTGKGDRLRTQFWTSNSVLGQEHYNSCFGLIQSSVDGKFQHPRWPVQVIWQYANWAMRILCRTGLLYRSFTVAANFEKLRRISKRTPTTNR